MFHQNLVALGLTFVVFLSLDYADAAAVTPEEKQQALEIAAMTPSTWTTEDFVARLESEGGGVDFVFGDDRPFPQCHASTIVGAEDGSILCAWFGGKEEKAEDVGIWLSRYVDDAWTAPVEVAKVIKTPHWNPVLFRDPARGTYLFFKFGREIPFWETAWMETTDSGKTWSAPVELVPFDQGGRGPVKNKAIVLSDGTWLAGASTEYRRWDAFADRSEDGGKTWTRSADFAIDHETFQGEGAIQPTLWESEPGKVHALLRTTAGTVGRADSSDNGQTWTAMYLTDLPNNNSGIDVLKVDDGSLYLVYNPVGVNWGGRSPLTLAKSTDNGLTWTNLVHLENEMGSEFSYPAIVGTTEGIAISYTWKRQRIRCWRIPAEAL
jgi:predicted neuraminidase